MSPSDDMPKQVCFKCVEKLDIAYDLYLMCNSAQTTIKRLLKFTQENSKPAPKVSRHLISKLFLLAN